MLEVRGVCLSFGGVQALHDVSLDVGRHEVVGLVGPNGAGKTTLFNVLSGFLRADAGSARLRGVELCDCYPHERIALGLGRTFQNVRLFPRLAVFENLLVALHSHGRSSAMASLLRLPAARTEERRLRDKVEQVIDLFGLDYYRHTPAAALSYGTLRLVELAVVVALGPSLLLLDEPSSGVAQKEVEALGPLLRRVVDDIGATVLIIEHDIPLLLSLSDRLYALELGEVIASGRPKDVLEDPAVAESFLGRAPERA